MERSAETAVTVVDAEAVLFERFGSTVAAVTTAVFVNEVVPVTLTTMVTRAKPGDGIEPRLQTTVPFWPTAGPRQLPWLCANDWNTVPTGRGSVRTTPCAVLGPWFVTPSWYVTLPPVTTDAG